MNAPLLQLPRLPSPLPAYRRALTSLLRRRESADAPLPRRTIQVRGVAVPARQLEAYLEVCGLRPTPRLPITFPQVLAGRLHLHLLSDPDCPLPLLGLVHVANDIQQDQPIATEEMIDLRVRFGESREVNRGREFDLLTEAIVDGTTRWRAITTVLQITRRGERKGPPPPAEVTSARYLPLEAPADVGRRYARVSGDYNPIHLSTVSARLFGFPRAIAHGMWSLARCLALLQELRDHDPRRLTVRFKQPLLLPARAALRYWSQPELEFTLVGGGGAVHLHGCLR